MINLTVISENNKNIVLTRLDNFTNYNFSQNQIQNNLDYTNYFVNVKTSTDININQVWNLIDIFTKDYMVMATLFFAIILIFFGISFIKKIGEQ